MQYRYVHTMYLVPSKYDRFSDPGAALLDQRQPVLCHLIGWGHGRGQVGCSRPAVAILGLLWEGLTLSRDAYWVTSYTMHTTWACRGIIIIMATIIIRNNHEKWMYIISITQTWIRPSIHVGQALHVIMSMYINAREELSYCVSSCSRPAHVSMNNHYTLNLCS